jgi:hypothetical protein
MAGWSDAPTAWQLFSMLTASVLTAVLALPVKSLPKKTASVTLCEQTIKGRSPSREMGPLTAVIYRGPKTLFEPPRPARTAPAGGGDLVEWRPRR